MNCPHSQYGGCPACFGAADSRIRALEHELSEARRFIALNLEERALYRAHQERWLNDLIAAKDELVALRHRVEELKGHEAGS